PTSPPASTPTRAAAQAAMDRLFAAGAAGDRHAWDAGTANLDAAFAVRSSVLFANLRALRPTRLRVHLTGAEQPLPQARQAALGTKARVVQAELTWRLSGERADASSSVWLTLVPGADGAQLAGTDDGTRLDTPAVPLWWLGPVARLAHGNVTVLVGTGQPAARWAGLASRAARDARAHLPAVLRQEWDGHLVVEVPGNEADFARVLGASPTAYATTAAITRTEGPTTAAAVRVVVNPATAQDSDAELGTTLVHETVHVATRSATSGAPLWAVEGLAEYVALEAHPDQRSDELAALRTKQRPTRLPPDSAFTARSKDVTAAYAEAWLACRTVAQHRGRTDLGRFYLALDDGRPVDDAARATLDVDSSTVVGWWRDALSQAPGSRG
ncbi:MAG: hypothetical protein ACRYG2_07795, partial [Janthinobacterium lividum]